MHSTALSHVVLPAHVVHDEEDDVGAQGAWQRILSRVAPQALYNPESIYVNAIHTHTHKSIFEPNVIRPQDQLR